MKRLSVLLIFYLKICVVPCFGANFYVDFNYGSDSIGDGSAYYPWKTLAYAAKHKGHKIIPGDQIIIKAGVYGDLGRKQDRTLPAINASEKKRIILRGEYPNGVIIKDKEADIKIRGNYWTVRDLNYDKADGKYLIDIAAKGIRVTNVRFEKTQHNDPGRNANGPVCIGTTGRSPDTEIDHCEFENIIGLPIYATSPGSTGFHIHHNIFKNLPELPDTHNHSAIIVGGGRVGPEDHLFSIVEYNVFQNCKGDPETISNKSSSNIYRYNHFKDSYELNLRYGMNCVIQSNYFEGNGRGLRVSDTGHFIQNNFFNSLTGEFSLYFQTGYNDETKTYPAGGIIISNKIRKSRTKYIIRFGTQTKGWTEKITNLTFISNEIQNDSSKNMIYFSYPKLDSPIETWTWNKNVFDKGIADNLCSGIDVSDCPTDQEIRSLNLEIANKPVIPSNVGLQ